MSSPNARPPLPRPPSFVRRSIQGSAAFAAIIRQHTPLNCRQAPSDSFLTLPYAYGNITAYAERLARGGEQRFMPTRQAAMPLLVVWRVRRGIGGGNSPECGVSTRGMFVSDTGALTSWRNRMPDVLHRGQAPATIVTVARRYKRQRPSHTLLFARATLVAAFLAAFRQYATFCRHFALFSPLPAFAIV